MLVSEPSGAHQRVIQVWNSLTPLTAEEIVANSEAFFKEQGPEVEFKNLGEVTDELYMQWNEVGFYKKGTNVRHGIARRGIIGGTVYIGMFMND